MRRVVITGQEVASIAAGGQVPTRVWTSGWRTAAFLFAGAVAGGLALGPVPAVALSGGVALGWLVATLQLRSKVIDLSHAERDRRRSSTPQLEAAGRMVERLLQDEQLDERPRRHLVLLEARLWELVDDQASVSESAAVLPDRVGEGIRVTAEELAGEIDRIVEGLAAAHTALVALGGRSRGEADEALLWLEAEIEVRGIDATRPNPLQPSPGIRITAG